MLILSRLRDEKVIITVAGIRITVILVDIRGERVRLGFDAPLDVSVHREEVQAAIDGASDRLIDPDSWGKQ